MVANDRRAEGLTGADLASLVREAGTVTLRRMLQAAGGVAAALSAQAQLSAPSISSADLSAAFAKVLPSVSAKDLRRYRSLQNRLRGSRAVMSDETDAPAPGPSPLAAGGAAEAAQ